MEGNEWQRSFATIVSCLHRGHCRSHPTSSNEASQCHHYPRRRSGLGRSQLHGNSNVPTPNIDSLARAGAMSRAILRCPVCAPTRAEFLTGRYHSRGGVRGVTIRQERLNLDEKTIADDLQGCGLCDRSLRQAANGSSVLTTPTLAGSTSTAVSPLGIGAEYFDPQLDHNGQPYVATATLRMTSPTALEFIEKNKSSHSFAMCLEYSAFSFAVPDRF